MEGLDDEAAVTNHHSRRTLYLRSFHVALRILDTRLVRGLIMGTPKDTPGLADDGQQHDEYGRLSPTTGTESGAIGRYLQIIHQPTEP